MYPIRGSGRLRLAGPAREWARRRLEDATAASTPVACCWIRRAPEVAGMFVGDAEVGMEAGAVELKASRQQKGQFGLGQPAYLLEEQY